MAGRKTFTAGEVLQAADVNDFLMDQSVMVFAGTAARGSAIPSPSEGMVTYRSDDDVVEVFDGSAFVPIAEEPVPPAILQVVSTTKTDTFSASLAVGAFTAVTGLTATITPSSTSSKILVSVSVNGSGSDGTPYGMAGFRFTRGGTVIGVGDAAGSRSQVSNMSRNGQSGNNDILSTTQTFLDSPATTSATTYGVDIGQVFFGGTGTIYVNRSVTDTSAGFVPRAASTITVMEVAG